MVMDEPRTFHAFAPATVSNVACGFDVLGFAIDGPGDYVVARERPEPGVELLEITGDGGRLPIEPGRNTAGVAASALLEATGCDRGVALSLHKDMPLSSGLGSSAASGAVAAYATSRLFGLEASRELLLNCAMAGEKVACGSAHADNAAPAVYGGLVLIRACDPPDVVSLPVPAGLSCAIVRPHIEIETRASRDLLGDTVSLRAAVTQWGNLGALVAGLFRGDLELIARSLEDVIAEPKRAAQVPGFAAVKGAALDQGAMGCSLSGSGPAIFALCATRPEAERVAAAMAAAFEAEGMPSDRNVTPVGCEGVREVVPAGK